jgi:hypothetical protein
MEVTPGTYQIYIENQNGISNTMNFTVTQFQTLPQPISAPPEYNLLKDIDKWILNYQDTDINYTDINSLICLDGRKGNVGLNYVFTMVSKGYGDPPGDIDTPYKKVVSILQNNGWQKCKTSELDGGKLTSEVFIKNNRLIGVFRSYSMGVGNYLTVKIQYEAAPTPTNPVQSSIKILSPNGGEKWMVGETYEIRWTGGFNVKNVFISLLDYNKPQSDRNFTPYTIASYTSNTGVYKWTIPSWLGGVTLGGSNYKIYVGGYGYDEAALRSVLQDDQSDAPFSIVGQSTNSTYLNTINQLANIVTSLNYLINQIGSF